MAALEVDSYKKRLVDATMTGQNANTTKVYIYYNMCIDFGLTHYERYQHKLRENIK
jgi:hypothetical protein